MRIGIAITRASRVDRTWTTIHLAQAALERGHIVRFIEPWDFEVNARATLLARAHAFDEPVGVDAIAEALQERSALRRYLGVSTLDVLLLRCAPFNPTVFGFALRAKALGVRVVNDPAGLVQVADKAWLASVPGLATPDTVITQSRGVAEMFFREQYHGVVIKPSRGSGGKHVSFVPPRDEDAFDDALSAVIERGRYAVIQSYLPSARDGEKRLVWVDGEVIGGYLRRRAPGEFRHNLKQGGQPEATEITSAERALVAKLSPELLSLGIRLAGLDLIGEHIVEVNALNPGGTYHADRLSGTRLAETIIKRLEQSEAHGFSPPPDQEAGRRSRQEG